MRSLHATQFEVIKRLKLRCNQPESESKIHNEYPVGIPKFKTVPDRPSASTLYFVGPCFALIAMFVCEIWFILGKNVENSDRLQLKWYPAIRQLGVALSLALQLAPINQRSGKFTEIRHAVTMFISEPNISKFNSSPGPKQLVHSAVDGNHKTFTAYRLPLVKKKRSWLAVASLYPLVYPLRELVQRKCGKSIASCRISPSPKPSHWSSVESNSSKWCGPKMAGCPYFWRWPS